LKINLKINVLKKGFFLYLNLNFYFGVAIITSKKVAAKKLDEEDVDPSAPTSDVASILTVMMIKKDKRDAEAKQERAEARDMEEKREAAARDKEEKREAEARDREQNWRQLYHDQNTELKEMNKASNIKAGKEASYTERLERPRV